MKHFDFEWVREGDTYVAFIPEDNYTISVLLQDDETWFWIMKDEDGSLVDASQFHAAPEFKTHYEAMKDANLNYWVKVGERAFTAAGKEIIKEMVGAGELPVEVLGKFNVVIFEESDFELRGE